MKEAVESVLCQTYTDFELLVIDDCSSDDTLDVVRRLEDPRIRIVKNERNLGLADNLNRGLSLITTDYVARMDGDDIALPHWLEAEVNYLESHSEVGVCGGGGVRFGTVSSIIRFPEEHDDIAVNLLFQCTIVVPTFRMSLYREHGLRYRSDAFPAEDYCFWSEVCAVMPLHNINDTLFRYRMHATQICTSLKKEQQVKVAEVQRRMLAHIQGLTREEMDYFTGPFLERVESVGDWSQRRAFSKRLILLNGADGFFCSKALKRQLLFQLRQRLYNTIVERYFSKGYNIASYWNYLKSGLALRLGFHYETRFFIKSILRRK